MRTATSVVTEPRRASRGARLPRRAAVLGLWAASLVVLPFGDALAELDSVRSERVAASLVTDAATIAPNTSFWVGLRLELAPGWHTYWLNPGDSGLATSIEWELPEGVVAGDIRWPVPERFATGHLMNFGYDDEVILLTRMSAWPPVGVDGGIEIAANASWLVCSDICVMEEGRLVIRVPTGEAATRQPEKAAMIGRFADRLPRGGSAEGRFDLDDETLRLRIALPSGRPRNAEDIWFYPERFGVIAHAADQPMTLDGDDIELTLTRGELRHERLERLRGVLVIRHDGGRLWGIPVDARPG